tara:strand:+ start:18772 stop:19341 length:570 start_codon:yes stop_codon:yes gene_type:complete
MRKILEKFKNLKMSIKYLIFAIIGNALTISGIFINDSYSWMSFLGMFLIVYTGIKHTTLHYSYSKFYRKYIKRNKIWIKENYKDNGSKWSIISDLYIKNLNVGSSIPTKCKTISINPEEVFNNYDVCEKVVLLEIVDSYKKLGIDVNKENLFNLYFDFDKKKVKLVFDLENNIFRIKLREKNINDMLDE